MTQVRTFVANVEDRDEWGFNGAFVAIHTASETSQTTYDSKECTGDYEKDVSSHVIKYKAQFWKDKQTQLDGKPSRALFEKWFVETEKVTEKDSNGGDKEDASGNLILTGEVVDAHWEYGEIFTVDLENEQAQRIASNNDLSKEDTIFNLIEFDLKRRVEQ